MRAFVAGATGVLGRRVVHELTGRGHEARGLTDGPRGDRVVENRGGIPRRGSVDDPDGLATVLAGTETLVYVPTTAPTRTADADHPEETALVRPEMVRTLLDAARATGVRRIVATVPVWAYRRPDGSPFDEDAPPNPDPSTRWAVEVERLVRDAGGSGLDATVLRLGWCYGPESPETRDLGEALLDGSLRVVGTGFLGRGDTTVSVLHYADAAGAVATAVEAGTTGTFHVVDDDPVTTAALFGHLADALGTDPPRRLPAWLARRLVGEGVVRFLTSDFPTASDRFRAAAEWERTYPTAQEGTAAVVDRWRETGRLVRTPEGRYLDRSEPVLPGGDR